MIKRKRGIPLSLRSVFLFGLMLSLISNLILVSDAGAELLIRENFDDQVVDPEITVYSNNWHVCSYPGDYAFIEGRGGQGYSFVTAGQRSAYLNWKTPQLPSSWPSDELYVSFWMRYPTFTSTDPMENIKVFYPHWNGTSSYVHYSMASGNTIYYSAKGSGDMLTSGNWINCPNQTDGNWHHYEFYIKFSTAQSRFWYDGVLKRDDNFSDGVWSNRMYYVSAPSIDSEEAGVFTRAVDDWEVWDSMPGSEPGDDQPPSITITDPTSQPTYDAGTSVIDLGGTASDNEGVVAVTWSNSRGGSGSAAGTNNWTVSAIPISEGVNVITVSARDDAGNTGSDTITVTGPEVPPDTTPPVISGVSASSVGATGATVTWSTSEPATSQVEYGLSGSYGSSTSENSTLRSTHTVALSGLTPETTYHFRVRSRDEAGNTAVSGDRVLVTSAVPGGVLIDNLTPADYEIDTIGIGTTVYLDRPYQVSELPAAFEGLQFIRGRNEDRRNTSENFLRFRVDRAVKVYVCYATGRTPPNWLSSFQDTGLQVTRLYLTLDVYVKEFPAGEIVLGGNQAAGADSGSFGMYFVMIEAADEGGSLPGKPGKPFVIGK